MELLSTITVGQVVCAGLSVALIYDVSIRLREYLDRDNSIGSGRTDP